MTGCCELGNERLCSLECGEFLDKARNCWSVKKESAPWRFPAKCVTTNKSPMEILYDYLMIFPMVSALILAI